MAGGFAWACQSLPCRHGSMTVPFAAYRGDEAAVRRMLAEHPLLVGEQDQYGRTVLHQAVDSGRVGMVQLLLAAGAPADAVDLHGCSALHNAAHRNDPSIIQLLLDAAPCMTAVSDKYGLTPLHSAATCGNVAAVRLLLQACPSTAWAADEEGHTPFSVVTGYLGDAYLRDYYRRKPLLAAARCLLPTVPAVQPALDQLVAAGPRTATLYADLVCRLPLTAAEWQRIPAPCPDLARALPAVLARSTAEAGWLVERLSAEQRRQLRTAALSLARAQRWWQSRPTLPAELSGRILALGVAHEAPLQDAADEDEADSEEDGSSDEE